MAEEWTEIMTKIRGVTRDDPNTGLSRQTIIENFIRPGSKLKARLEPENPKNPNAIAVWFERSHLGYLSDKIANDLAERMRNKARVSIIVLSVTGGTEGKDTLGVNIVLRYLDVG